MIMSTTMPGLRERREDAAGDAGLILHAAHADLRLVAVVGDPRHEQPFHHLFLRNHPGAFAVVERRAHVDPHAVAHGEAHRAQVQHLRAEARHLDHLVVGDAVELARRGHQVRIASCRRRRRRCRSRRRRRRSAAATATAEVSEPPRPERRHVALVVDALEAGDHGHGAAVEDLEDAAACRCSRCARACARCRCACPPARR